MYTSNTWLQVLLSSLACSHFPWHPASHNDQVPRNNIMKMSWFTCPAKLQGSSAARSGQPGPGAGTSRHYLTLEGLTLSPGHMQASAESRQGGSWVIQWQWHAFGLVIITMSVLLPLPLSTSLSSEWLSTVHILQLRCLKLDKHAAQIKNTTLIIINEPEYEKAFLDLSEQMTRIIE